MAKSKKSWVNLKNRKFKTDLEKFVNKAIPYVLVVLAGLIILDNPFWSLVDLENYEPYVSILDYIVVAFFVVDLYFKWEKTRNVGKFVRLYWIELLAVFPIYLVSRAFILTSELFRTGEEVQKILHETVLIREASLLEEGKILTRVDRLAVEARPLLKGFRAGARLFRLIVWRFKVSHHHMVKSSMFK